MSKARSHSGLVVLLVVAAGLVGMNVRVLGEHFHRSSLQSDGVVVPGRVVDRVLAHCSGLRCSQRTVFDGEIGSREYRAFRDTCGSGRRYRCHTDLVVRYEFAGRAWRQVGQVTPRDFERTDEGSEVAVLVDADDPSRSILRDFDPESFLLYVALFSDGVAALAAFVMIAELRRSRGRRRKSRG